MTGFRRFSTLLLAALALITGVSACATRQHSTVAQIPADDPASAFPAKVEIPGQEPVTLVNQPKRIVSLSPTATESLYAIGAGDQVVAVDQNSDFPKQAPRTQLSGFNADPAAVADKKPDLVIAPDNATPLANGLKASGVPVLLTPSAHNLDEAYQQITALGQATGHRKQAEALVNQMRGQIDQIIKATPRPPQPLTYFHEASPDLYTANAQTFAGNVYSLFGMVNIADPAAGEFPQVSSEQVVKANPTLIFLADTKGGVSKETVKQRPGWNGLDAVKHDRVIELDDDLASRWGPRVVDLIKAISDAVSKAQHG